MESSIFSGLWRAPDQPRQRGGWRQRAAAAAAADQLEPSIPLLCVLRHLKDWGMGVVSSVKVWWHMDAIWRDGLQKPAIKKICDCAAIETDKNLHANLAKLLLDLGFDHLITAVNSGTVMHAVRPTVMLGWLAKHPAKFRRCLGAEERLVLAFWTIFLQTPHGTPHHSL